MRGLRGSELPSCWWKKLSNLFMYDQKLSKNIKKNGILIKPLQIWWKTHAGAVFNIPWASTWKKEVVFLRFTFQVVGKNYTLAANDPKQRKGLRPEELLLAFFACFTLLGFLALLALLALFAYLCSAIYAGKLGAYSLEAHTLGAYSLGGATVLTLRILGPT